MRTVPVFLLGNDFTNGRLLLGLDESRVGFRGVVEGGEPIAVQVLGLLETEVLGVTLPGRQRLLGATASEDHAGLLLAFLLFALALLLQVATGRLHRQREHRVRRLIHERRR